MKKLIKKLEHDIEVCHYAKEDLDSRNWREQAGVLLTANEAQQLVNALTSREELLIDFFIFFRDNGEANIGASIEDFVTMYLNQKR